MCAREEMRRAREQLRSARRALCQAPSSPANCRLWKQQQAQFCAQVADVNVKVDRLNVIVPTLYQQIARFDVAKEQQTIVDEQAASPPAHEQQHTAAAAANNSSVTLTDVLRELKALFAART